MEILKETHTFLTFFFFTFFLVSTGKSRNEPVTIVLGDVGYYLKVYNGINTYRSKHVSQSLRWNRTLNDVAEILALQLARDVSQPDPEDMEGVNYYAIRGPRPSASLVVSRWYNESFLYDYNAAHTVSNTNCCLNFTQLIWRSSTTVGIGAATYNNFSVVVAKFAPPGNLYGKFRQNVIPPRVQVQLNLTLTSS